MASTVNLWTPPVGMRALDVKAWRAFYGRAIDVYGVTPARYRALYITQKGRCWICRTATGIHPDDPKARGTRRLGIDHNHTTGQVRGLLCTAGPMANVPGCNWIIGVRGPAALRRAADYLDGTATPGLVLTGEAPEDMEWAHAVLWGNEMLPSVPVVPGR